MPECFCTIIAIEHDFLMHLHLVSTLGGVENLAFRLGVFNTSLRDVNV